MNEIPPEMKMAYLDIDVGSMSDKRENRKKLLSWSMNNMVEGGLILTNKKLALELTKKWDFDIIELNSFDIPALWKNVHETRLNTKVLIKMGNK